MLESYAVKKIREFERLLKKKHIKYLRTRPKDQKTRSQLAKEMEMLVRQIAQINNVFFWADYNLTQEEYFPKNLSIENLFKDYVKSGRAKEFAERWPKFWKNIISRKNRKKVEENLKYEATWADFYFFSKKNKGLIQAILFEKVA